MKILCKFGLHKYRNEIFYKEPHEIIKKIQKKCLNCGKKKMTFYNIRGLLKNG